MIIPDPLHKTVLIPAKMHGDKLRFLYGGELPAIADGAVVDLIVPAHAVKEEEKLVALQRTSTETFLPKGTELMAQLRPKEITLDEAKRLNDRVFSGSSSGAYGASIVLQEELEIHLRGTKKAELAPCSCLMPSLIDKEASSLNEAYYLVSREFERHRKSHTGNVFDKIFYLDEMGPWRPLGDLRSQFEAKFEEELMVLWQEWWRQRVGLAIRDYWILLERQPAESVILHTITTDRVHIGALPFSKEADAKEWLQAHGYMMFRWGEEAATMPPHPPYEGRDGTRLELGIDGVRSVGGAGRGSVE